MLKEGNEIRKKFFDILNAELDKDYIKIEHISNFLIKDAINMQNIKETDNNDKKNDDIKENIFNSIQARQSTNSIEEKENSKLQEEILKNIGNTKMSFKERIEESEIMIIRNALNDAGGNVAEAARKLDLPRQTLKNKMVKYDIKPIF